MLEGNQAALFTERQKGTLPGDLGLEWEIVANGQARGGFTTIEIKTNYLGTAKPGERVTCEARLVHGGRMTQVWDAEAVNATTGKTIAVFRCTQMVLWPR